MTPQQLSQRLAQRVEAVALMLYPQGKRIGHEFHVGGTDGDSGDSLKIQLSGAYAGHWKDWATEEHGDLLDLWCAARGLKLTEAMAEAASYLGIPQDGRKSQPKKSYRTPDRPRETQRLNPDGAVMAYLKFRGLTEVTLTAYRMAEQPGHVKFPNLANNPGTILFPYLRDGQLVNVKYLALERPNGKKATLQEKDAEPCLFGWQAIPANARSVVVVEGELDAATWFQMGYPALSVPMGGGTGAKQDWIESDFDRLERFDTIYVAMDMDDPGQAAAKEIIVRLGAERCRLVEMPYKDANDALMNGATAADFAQWLARAKSQDPEELKPADAYTQGVMDQFFPPPGTPPAVQMPWRKTHHRIQFRRGEVTIWAGYGGHGKSLVINQVAAASTIQSERSRWCIASMEMLPAVTLSRMMRQIAGQACPSPQTITQTLRFIGESLWLFDLVGTAKVDRMLDVFAYAVKRYDIHQFVIDSLAKCGVDEDDYPGQKAVVERLTDFAHQYHAHVHLVCHARKGSNEMTPPGKMDIKGTGAITDMADNVVIVWRNKPKEAQVEQLPDHQPLPPDIQAMPDTQLIVTKQRYTGWEGAINLWFDPVSLQYLENAHDTALAYRPPAETP